MPAAAPAAMEPEPEPMDFEVPIDDGSLPS
jgi:hypothetical protein